MCWGGLKSGEELYNFLIDRKIKGVAIKKVTGDLGRDVYICDFEHGYLITPSRMKLSASSIDSLLDTNGDGFIVEEKLTHHNRIADVCGEGLSSLRIQTLRKSNGDVTAQLAYFRMGLCARDTDHATSGGINATVDLNTGTVKNGFAINADHASKVEVHPDTKYSFRGFEVPFWHDAIAMCLTAAKLLPRIHFVGWDVVITNEGPKIIEGNVGNSMSLYQLIAGPFLRNGIGREWADELGVDLPDGSLKWRLSHWDKARKLSLLEDIVSRSSRGIKNLL